LNRYNPNIRKARKESIEIEMAKILPTAPSGRRKVPITPNVPSRNKTTPVKNPRNKSKTLHEE
jgi:hypothetical protein